MKNFNQQKVKTIQSSLITPHVMTGDVIQNPQEEYTDISNKFQLLTMKRLAWDLTMENEVEVRKKDIIVQFIKLSTLVFCNYL